ncbi:mechanosensitive ion channel family protein [Pseudomonas sp. R2.Fl]|nr:mechanosensitive ion channel family protein [Pseudomonas sp. R2.Fl]
MEDQATEFFIATRAALSQASALAVQYSFSVLGAILLLLGGWMLASVLHRWSRTAMLTIRGFDVTLAAFMANVVRYIVLILVFVTVLGQFGVQTASIIAALGAAGLAIGLALQGTLQNIAAGIMLLVLRPFKVGDYIDTGTISGTVGEIGLFATELKTPEGMYRLAPNSTLWNVPITNFSREPTRRFDLNIGIGYRDDIEKAETIMRDLAEADPRIHADPPIETFVNEFADNAVMVTLRYWTSNADFWPVSRQMIKQVKRVFDETGITIPFPPTAYSSVVAATNPQGEDDEKTR